MNLKNIFKTVLILGAIVGIIAFIAPHNVITNTALNPEIGLRIIQLAGQDIRVSVVSTPEDRVKGLGGRTGLATNEGMLFIFDMAAKYGFWMKDMLFSIDILWLSDKGEILDMVDKVGPGTYPTVFSPKVPARYVLELPSGFVEAYSVKVGDIVRL
ncbi:hypothetical protein A3C86_04190 [Candidatus Kaiserbacteria bacterium RIFCSPHIGHO2_02_FULL_49_16]|uniref:DUF192 domain-containing protein n=1 Tax=Candidatus Kaiserbacteria bacterium RIFCSPHIGHO2_02_FULL_49_16 TaxID=1798490 RepID=A0A1F6DHZ2_9BACT|nr:MAG: hypothetical protein A3C86_04190 [Candidatus Kaiserbacteria bacterium RIFCSPHIGHO2_02_FULL_49_16]